MITTINKTPRLLEAAKEFNIGRETLVAFLTDQGFEITSNPSARITEKMYNALQIEFAQDKLAKRRSEEIALPKGSLLDNLRKPKEDLVIIPGKDKKEEPQAPIQKPKIKEEAPKEAEKAKEKAIDTKEEPDKKTVPAAQPVIAIEEPAKKAPVVAAPPAIEEP